MKNDMYTYHYFKNRSIAGAKKTTTYLVQTVVICGIAYAAITLEAIFH